jgi:hypothetical protein
METSEALEVVKLLSDGIDPETGEILANDSTFNNPKIIRALFVAIKALERSIKNDSRRKGLPENAGKPWTEEENSQLVEEFDKGENIAQISKHHLRTKGAIASQLSRLGKIIYRT